MDEMGGEKGDEARWFIFIPVSFFLFFLSKTKLLGLLWDPRPIAKKGQATRTC